MKTYGVGVNEWEVCHAALKARDFDCFLLAGRYTLLEQTPLARLFPECERRGTRIIIGGPYNSGILVGGTTWNYADAPEDLRARVHRMRDICDRHGVPLPAAALQFCLAHPVVETVIPGARTSQELRQALEWIETRIPDGLWADLKRDGLLEPQAPTTGTSRP